MVLSTDITGTGCTTVNKADSVPAFGKPLIWWGRKAMKWTMKKPDALKVEAQGCITGVSNPVREDRHFLAEMTSKLRATGQVRATRMG